MNMIPEEIVNFCWEWRSESKNNETAGSGFCGA
jgi:hypothetical protein